MYILIKMPYKCYEKRPLKLKSELCFALGREAQEGFAMPRNRVRDAKDRAGGLPESDGSKATQAIPKLEKTIYPI